MITNYKNPQKGFLSEEQVARFFFPYLKEFYRYRYEFKPESLDTKEAQVSMDGIKADGVLTFKKADGTPFLCAFEATGREVMEEVKYRTNTKLFIWDCITFSVLLTTMSYAFFFLYQPLFLRYLGWIGNFGFISGCLIFFYSAWYFLMQRWEKYRYIYAVEQFKQYFADEQWVAIASDVFPGRDDPYMAELKNQCMYHGFGLVVVGTDGVVQPVATPSRLGVYGKDRRMRAWLTDTELYKTMQDARKLGDKVPKGLSAVLVRLWRPIQQYAIKPIRNSIWSLMAKPLNNGNSAFSKYMRSYSYQKYLSGAALLVLGFMAARSIQFRTIEYVDEEKYGNALKNRPYRENPEYQDGYVIDDRPWYKQEGVPRQYPEETVERLASNGINQQPVTYDSRTRYAKQGNGAEIDLNPIEKTPKPVLYAATEQRSPIKTLAKSVQSPKGIKAPTLLEGCDFMKKNAGWVIQDNYFSTMDYAKERQEELKIKGISSRIVPTNCSCSNVDGYWLFALPVHSTLGDAEKALIKYRKSIPRKSQQGNNAFLKKL